MTESRIDASSRDSTSRIYDRQTESKQHSSSSSTACRDTRYAEIVERVDARRDGRWRDDEVRQRRGRAVMRSPQPTRRATSHTLVSRLCARRRCAAWRRVCCAARLPTGLLLASQAIR
ncbi:hypothetical protein CIHG_04359 [Coccidioides immitis H538.4]|uniref:Uncharacterized protein n=1 Tax=Coccidioides immitis H538.4 TaxID=396776 RepID=A0A0J8RPM6_COCIT|nr:hypothetical protein CIHG_04359 [Coccidioides immitis H538.4]